jgi:hypothetical protein
MTRLLITLLIAAPLPPLLIITWLLWWDNNRRIGVEKVVPKNENKSEVLVGKIMMNI